MLIGTRPTFSKLGFNVVVWEAKRSRVLFFFLTVTDMSRNKIFGKSFLEKS